MPNWQGAQVEVDTAFPTAGPGGTGRQPGTASGAAVDVYAAPVAAADAEAVEDRLRRLRDAQVPGTPRVVAYAVDEGTGWVAVEPDRGLSLDRLAGEAPLPPGDGAAVGWQVLETLEALHELSMAHGSMGPEAIRIGADGRARLIGHWFNPARRLGAEDAAADLAAAGGALCTALGVPVRSGSPPAGAELMAPALARTLRAIANGASGGNVTGARMALGSTASALVRPQAISDAGHRLGERVRAATGSRPAPAGLAGAATPSGPAAPERPITVPGVGRAEPKPDSSSGPVPPPAIAEQATPPQPAPGVPYQRYVASAADLRAAGGGWPGWPGWPARAIDARRLAVPAAILVGLLLVFLLGRAAFGALGARPARSPQASAPTARTTPVPTATGRPSAAPSQTPNPRATPDFGPAAASPIRSVDLRVAPGCSAGGSCSVEVQVNTASAGSTTQVSWTVKAWDACTGATTPLADDGVQEQGGWTSVIGDRGVSVPAGRSVYLVAVTTAPAAAASQLVSVTQGTAC